jgi:hypothetical protein
MRSASVYPAATAGFSILTAVAGLLLLQSGDTLTDRVAVEQAVFDQRPDRFGLLAGGRRLELIRSASELGSLKAHARSRGLSPPAEGESDLGYSMRAARWIQDVVRHGKERKNYFRGWGFKKVMADIEAGERFWCGTYARLLAALALSEGIPARSVWMKGHVTSEIYSAELDKWVVVDAMYGHTLSSGGQPLSATEVHLLLRSGAIPQVSLISAPGRLDEPVKPIFDEVVAGVYGGGIFRVFDGDINFATDVPRLLLPAMSLSTDVDPGGTSAGTRTLRIALPALALLALLSAGAWLGRRRTHRRNRGLAALARDEGAC